LLEVQWLKHFMWKNASNAPSMWRGTPVRMAH